MLTFECIKEAAERLKLGDPVISIIVSPRVAKVLQATLENVTDQFPKMGICAMLGTRVEESAFLPDHLYIEKHEKYWLLKNLTTGQVLSEFKTNPQIYDWRIENETKCSRMV